MSDSINGGNGTTGEIELLKASINLWRTIAVSSITAFMMIGGIWFSYARNSITQTQMVDYVSHYSPYVVAAGEISAQINDTSAECKTVEMREYQDRQDIDKLMGNAGKK